MSSLEIILPRDTWRQGEYIKGKIIARAVESPFEVLTIKIRIRVINNSSPQKAPILINERFTGAENEINLCSTHIECKDTIAKGEERRFPFSLWAPLFCGISSSKCKFEIIAIINSDRILPESPPAAAREIILSPSAAIQSLLDAWTASGHLSLQSARRHPLIDEALFVSLQPQGELAKSFKEVQLHIRIHARGHIECVVEARRIEKSWEGRLMAFLGDGSRQSRIFALKYIGPRPDEKPSQDYIPAALDQPGGEAPGAVQVILPDGEPNKPALMNVLAAALDAPPPKPLSTLLLPRMIARGLVLVGPWILLAAGLYLHNNGHVHYPAVQADKIEAYSMLIASPFYLAFIIFSLVSRRIWRIPEIGEGPGARAESYRLFSSRIVIAIVVLVCSFFTAPYGLALVINGYNCFPPPTSRDLPVVGYSSNGEDDSSGSYYVHVAYWNQPMEFVKIPVKKNDYEDAKNYLKGARVRLLSHPGRLGFEWMTNMQFIPRWMAEQKLGPGGKFQEPHSGQGSLAAPRRAEALPEKEKTELNIGSMKVEK